MEQWKDILKKCVEEAGAKFEKNELGSELAFLALQGKIELQLRDKIAWLLQQYYGDKYYIKKEYGPGQRSKCDLAILDKEFVPICLIEFKAHSAPNFGSAKSQLAEYQDYFTNDMDKMKDLKKGSNAECFYIFFQTIHTKQIEDDHKCLIPYSDIINREVNYGENQNINLVNKWTEMCCNIDGEITRCKDIEAGEYLGYNIKIATMIFGPEQ